MRYLFWLLLILSVSLGQINDKISKKKLMVEWLSLLLLLNNKNKTLMRIFSKGVKGYQDCKIIRVKSEDAPKVVKKLGFRNFPSLALFYDGSKKETWKADMDGELDIDNRDIKGSIDDVLAEDVF